MLKKIIEDEERKTPERSKMEKEVRKSAKKAYYLVILESHMYKNQYPFTLWHFTCKMKRPTVTNSVHPLHFITHLTAQAPLDRFIKLRPIA